jgi:hypothetical protein
MFCPQCRSEYREGFTRCDNCDRALVAVLPPLPEEGDTSHRELVTVFETGDPGLLALAHSILDEAEVPYLTLGEGVQDLFGLGRLGTGFSVLTGPAQLQVDVRQAAEARELLADLEEDAAAHHAGEAEEIEAGEDTIATGERVD